MEKSLLWQCFSSLTHLERKKLGQWLASPFFCRQAALTDLFLYLQECVQKEQVPETAVAQKRLRAKNDAMLRLYMSEMLDQLAHFLAYQTQFEQSADDALKVARAYRKRGLDKHFIKTLKTARANWEAQPYRHFEYYEALERMEYEAYQFQSMNRRTEALNLQALFDATDHAFIARKLRQACFGLTHQAVYKTEYDFGLTQAVVQYLSETPRLLEIPLIGLYYFCYRFLTEPEAEHYFLNFKTLLIRERDLLPPDIQRDLYLLAINYCIKKINQLRDLYFREALDLYRSALQLDILLENGHLSSFAYNNITAIALKVGEKAWASDFVHQYAPQLEKKYREANYQLNLARIAYFNKDYRQALAHLQLADYKDLINNLIAKTLLMKIYYETSEYDALDAHLQSMQVFLRRQKDIGYHFENYRNIIRLTKKLMLHNFNDRNATAALRRQIEQTSPLTEKEWLLAMVVSS